MPLGLGAAVSPIVFVASVTVMTGQGPLRRGLLFGLGLSLPLLAISASIFAFGAAISLPHASQASKAWIDVGLGAVLIALAIRSAAQGAAPVDQPQPEQPGGIRRPVLVGVGAMATNVTTIALYVPAMKLIAESSLPGDEEVLAAAIVLVLTLALVLLPLAIVAVAPRAAERILQAAGAWLAAHRHKLGVIILLGFGALLLAKGIARLL